MIDVIQNDTKRFKKCLNLFTRFVPGSEGF